MWDDNAVEGESPEIDVAAVNVSNVVVPADTAILLSVEVTVLEPGRTGIATTAATPGGATVTRPTAPVPTGTAATASAPTATTTTSTTTTTTTSTTTTTRPTRPYDPGQSASSH